MRSSCRDGQAAVFDPLGRDQSVGQAPHGIGGAAHGQDFHAGMVVEMHVQRGDDQCAVVMLDVREKTLDVSLMVVVDQCHRPGDLLMSHLAEVFDQTGPDHIGHRLRAVGVSLGLYHVVQLPGQTGRHAEAETGEGGCFHKGVLRQGKNLTPVAQVGKDTGKSDTEGDTEDAEEY